MSKFIKLVEEDKNGGVYRQFIINIDQIVALEPVDGFCKVHLSTKLLNGNGCITVSYDQIAEIRKHMEIVEIISVTSPNFLFQDMQAFPPVSK